MVNRIIATVVGLMLLQAAPWAQERKFYPDDPLLVDNDMLDVPDEPAEISLSDLFDRFGHIMTDLGDATRGEAQNVNTLDEVPDSSWFTNRHGVRRMVEGRARPWPRHDRGAGHEHPLAGVQKQDRRADSRVPDPRRPRRPLRHQVRPGAHPRAQLRRRGHRHQALWFLTQMCARFSPSRSAAPWEEGADALVPANQR